MSKSDGLGKHLAIAFAITVTLYFVTFNLIEHRRYVKGPWQVKFETMSNNVPVLTISQPALNIANVRVAFPGEAPPTNAPVSMEFVQPKQWPFEIPFGQIVFEDLTFLPGTVSCVLYGHEVELIPRTLRIDGAEYPWREGVVYSLSTTNKPAPLAPLKPKY